MRAVLIVNVVGQAKVVVITAYVRRLPRNEPPVSFNPDAVRAAAMVIFVGIVLATVRLTDKPFKKGHLSISKKLNLTFGFGKANDEFARFVSLQTR